MITFVGAGIESLNQMTLEALQQLQSSDRVLALEWDAEFFVQNSIKNVVDLRPLYRDGDKDEDNYKRIEDSILASANIGENVSILIPGHPRLGVTLVNRMQKLYPTKAISGISSFCTMIDDLAIDPLEKGTVILDANRLLLFEMELSNQMNHFIYHVCSIGAARTHYSSPQRGNLIDTLQEHLSKAFPKDHSIALVSSKTNYSTSNSIIWFQLCDLSKQLKSVTFDTTLFIPGIRPKRINKKFLDQLEA